MTEPYYQDEFVTLYNCDCREVLSSITADALVTDPPYGIGAAKAQTHSSIRDNPRWPKTEWDDMRQPEAVMMALDRCQDAAIWGGNFYADILPVSAGWLIWVKPQADTGFSMADAELCWTNREIAARVRRATRRDGSLHPTQKPLTIMDWTLSFMRGEIILDPFMGSGTTLVAAKQLGRKSIGIDADESYCEVAAKRLAQGSLFAMEA